MSGCGYEVGLICRFYDGCYTSVGVLHWMDGKDTAWPWLFLLQGVGTRIPGVAYLAVKLDIMD